MRINSRIPNFRNLGIHLRVLLMHLVLLFLFVMLQWQPGAIGLSFWSDLTAISLDLLPPMLLALALLSVSYPWLARLSYRQGMSVIVLIAVASTIVVTLVYQQFIAVLDVQHWLQVMLICLADISLTLYYLSLIQRAYSPAIAEARLQALQARIRPHFLFNSLNAVLSLIRNQPKQAETALEDMAELFRVLMADNRALVPLDQEIQLCKQYLAIEALRLGERLQCEWQLDALPSGLLIPPLILQPLVENAVYHGIESMPKGGLITVAMQGIGRSLLVRIQNPIPISVPRTHGNKMAMKNIRERLRLHYDLEARFSQQTKDQQFIVELSIPTRPMSEVLRG